MELLESDSMSADLEGIAGLGSWTLTILSEPNATVAGAAGGTSDGCSMSSETVTKVLSFVITSPVGYVCILSLSTEGSCRRPSISVFCWIDHCLVVAALFGTGSAKT